jgi:hypothetical protein
MPEALCCCGRGGWCLPQLFSPDSTLALRLICGWVQDGDSSSPGAAILQGGGSGNGGKLGEPRSCARNRLQREARRAHSCRA